MASNHIEKVAIVGASGHVGKHFTEALLKTGKHTVTAVTRTDSKATFPENVKISRVDYDDDDGQSLVAALQGQDFLVITLTVRAPPDTHSKIVQAAAKAGVKYIMPNTYGFDMHNEGLQKEDLFSGNTLKLCQEIEDLRIPYVAMACGFWYQWSLALGEPWFGFDIKSKKVTFFDDGNTKINTSTWPQCGRALAALLSLPMSGSSPSLEQWKDKLLFIASFRISQRDMLDSIHRVTGTTDRDWQISYEPTAERHKDGLDEMQKGQMTGFAKAMYSRIFYPNGDGDFESSKGLANDVVGLPKEDLDEATKMAVEMVESGFNGYN